VGAEAKFHSILQCLWNYCRKIIIEKYLVEVFISLAILLALKNNNNKNFINNFVAI